LEVLVYSARQLEDYELQLSYNTKLADAYRQQGDKVEALRTEAEIGAVLVRLGKTEEGLAKLDSVINILTPVRQFNELDASIIAMKRRIGVIRDYPQIETTALCIINRLDDFEQHPADFHDGSEREPADENRSGYIAFYRAQAWSYLAAAYAHLNEKGKAREYVALFEQSDFGQTFTGKKMIAPTLCLLGQYDKMEANYQELEAVFTERGDTVTLDYAQLLLDRAKAAEAQGRMTESTALWQRHAEVLQKAEERLLQSKANLYAARYHAQEQQREIERKDAEAKRNALFAWFVAVIALLLACFAVYYYLRHREESRKNRILARQITEAMDYKDKYLALLQTDQSAAETNPKTMEPTALFAYISQTIVRDQLFLDPAFDRQAAIDRFQLSKERIGAAFAQGSDYASITDFINECRLEYAVTLLRDQLSLPITQVAQASGFSDANYFGRKFKARFGLSPTDYRAGNS
jgi:AraC-like DNA-binding protein